ncbi:MAG TPA: MFS transporter [Patescibacteria group bacterium]|nr:MFS transporter [Patescibacteria group bacterium]
MSNYSKVFRDVIYNRNVITIAITTSLISLSGQAYRPYWGAYLKDILFADTVAIGLLSAIASSERLLFQLPGGILADRFGRRKIIVYGTALRMLPPIIYLLATHWTHTIPALLVSGAASIYMPAFNAIIADSLPTKQRGAGYGAYRMITSTPQFVSPIIGGVVMDWLGYQQGVQVFMVTDFFISAFVTYYRWKFLKETLDIEDRPGSGGRPQMGIRDSLTTVFRMSKSVKVMVLVTLFSSIGMRMVFDFLSLYALKQLNFTNTQLGLVTTVGGLISIVLSMPAGMLSDRFGRKPMILISRTVSPLSYLGVTQVTTYPQYFAVQFINNIGNAMGGGGMFAGGPAWNALLSELVPKEQLATVMGSIGTLSGIMAIPSPIIGGWLWDEYDPRMPFYVSVVFGLIGAAIFALGVKEPDRSEHETPTE